MSTSMSEFENRRVLVIDDDTRIHEDFRKILGGRSELSEYDEIEAKLFSDDSVSSPGIIYELESAYQGEEGFSKVVQAQKEGRPYAMAFVDMRMPPGWDGLQTIKHIWEVDSQIQLVICTAYSDYSWNEVMQHLGATDRLIILKKPFDMVEVQQMTTALTTKWSLGCENAARLIQAQESEEKYRSVVNSVGDAIITLDVEGNIRFVNQTAWHMSNRIVGDNYCQGIKEEHRENVAKAIAEVFATGQQQNVEYAIIGNANNTVWSEGRLSPFYENGKVVAVTLVASDISARKELDWQLRHDELTGLANRVSFVSHVQACLENKKAGQLFALLFIDLDHFNLINDCFGHDIGDKLLIKISKLLSKKIESYEVLARLGGDEFAILKYMNADESEVEKYVESINELLKQPLTVEGFDVYPSASIGIVIVDDKSLEVSSLFRNADAALYHAKSKGRNRHEYFDQKMRDKIVNRVSLGNELRSAIKEDQFEVYYQPLISLIENKVIGFEALVRWMHPAKGVVSPDDFIPIAEETGLIFAITRNVLEKVCVCLKKWEDAGLTDIKVAVNCSAREFNEQNLKKIITEIIKDTGANLQSLELELTESSIMDDVKSSIVNMHDLAKMGLNISIDDFGTGYSSFSYIKQFAIDKIKIDRSFIKDTPDDTDDSAIVEAIIAMAKRLKLKVVGEGVETAEQLDFLRHAGCDVVQGYLLGRPMHGNEATQRLKANDWPNAELLQEE